MVVTAQNVAGIFEHIRIIFYDKNFFFAAAGGFFYVRLIVPSVEHFC